MKNFILIVFRFIKNWFFKRKIVETPLPITNTPSMKLIRNRISHHPIHKPIMGNPMFFPKRTKLKGYQKENKRNKK